MITLTAGDWRATVRPDLGGSITSLSWRDHDVLRPTPADAAHPLQTACFPLVPYANRIDQGRFVFNGRHVHLSPTPGFEPHALHGEGWRRAWAVLEQDDRRVSLGLTHDVDDWPWAWSARQAFELADDGLRVMLTLTNEDRRAMPAGLGLHPYFVRRDGARLTLQSDGVWVGEEGLIPRRLAPNSSVFDWSDGPAVAAAPFVDNAYAGWNGTARIQSDRCAPVLEASPNARWAHVYAPDEQPFFCVEPVTHRPDAVNAPADEASGLAVLRSGETLSLTMTLRAG